MGALDISATLISFDPRHRIRFDPLSRLGFAFEAVNYRLSPSRKGETDAPFSGFRFDRFEKRLGLSDVPYYHGDGQPKVVRMAGMACG